MLISDISVRRPVFAAVISLILVIVGMISLSGMSIREFPDIQRPIVSVDTRYRGAASDIVERRVTQVIEDQVAGIAGITKMSSVSYDEVSRIALENLLIDYLEIGDPIRERFAEYHYSRGKALAERNYLER